MRTCITFAEERVALVRTAFNSRVSAWNTNNLLHTKSLVTGSPANGNDGTWLYGQGSAWETVGGHGNV